MSYPINQKINPALNPSMQASNGLSLEQLQAVDSQRIKQGINDNTVVDKVKKHDNPLLMLGVFIPTWILTQLGMNKFAKANDTFKYEDSLIGKIAAKGEKIGKLSIFNNNFTQKAQEYYGKVENFIKNKVIKNVDILDSFFNKRTIPENPTVSMQIGGIETELSSSGGQMFEKYVGNGSDKNDLISKLHKDFKKPNGEADVEAFEKLVKKPYGNENKILEICEANRGKGVPLKNVKDWGKIPFTDIYLSRRFPKLKEFFSTPPTFNEFANKLIGAKGAKTEAQTTLLGRKLPRATLKVIEGMVNAGTGGGLVASLMGAFFISDAIVRAVKAPKENGEKRKVFAENMIYGLGFYLTMPLALKIMHGFGGLQYLGVNDEKLKLFRKELAEFNAKAASGEFKVKADYIKELKRVKGNLKPQYTGNGLVKFAKKVVYGPVKFLAKVLTVGIERFAPFNPKGTKTTFGSLFKWEGFKQIVTNERAFWGKNIAGYALRFGVVLFGLGPFLAKFFAKGSHAVFGRPTKSVLDHEGESEKKAPNQQQPQMMPVNGAPNANQVQMMPTNQGGNLMGQNMNQKTMVSNPVNNDPTKNLVNMYNNKPASREMIATDKPARTYTYIPSTEGVKVEKDNSEDEKINALLNKSYNAEKAASKFGH